MRFFLIFLVVLTSGCKSGRSSSPEATLKSQLITGEAGPFSLIQIKVENLDPNREYEVEYDFGDISVRVPTRVDSRRDRLEAIAPLGRLTLDYGFLPGDAFLRVVRHDGDRESLSERMTLRITEGETINEWGDGFPSFAAVTGLQLAALEALSDTSQLEIATDRDLHSENTLVRLAEGVQIAQYLDGVIIAAMSGSPTRFGRYNGWSPSFWSFNLTQVDRAFLAMNDSLALVLGRDPPTIEGLDAFYSNLGHNPFQEYVIDSYFVVYSATMFMMDTVREYVRDTPGGVLNSAWIGGYMMSALSLAWASEVLSLSLPIGQATKGSQEFWTVWDEMRDFVSSLKDKTCNHFLLSDRSGELYGSFSSDGYGIAQGVRAVRDFVGGDIENAYIRGYLPIFGIPASGIDGLELEIDQKDSFYSVAVQSHPSIENLQLRMYVVRPGAQEEIFVVDGVTNEDGRVEFPEQRVGSGVDSLFIIDKQGDARVVWPVAF